MASKKQKGSNKNKKTANKSANIEQKEVEVKAEEKIDVPKEENEQENKSKVSEELKEKTENIDKKIAEIDEINAKEEPVKKEETPKEENKETANDKINRQEEIQKELLKQSVENKKRRIYIAISVLIIFAIIIVFSTIFALLNMNNANFIKGIKIKGIDVSGLTLEQARTKITEALNIELLQELNLKYKDEYEVTFDINQIEYIYDINKAINIAYQEGRNGNIIENNYTLLYTAFFGKNVEVEYTYNKEYLDDIVTDIESKIPGLVIQPTYYIEESELIVNKGEDGIVVDKENLKKQILSNIENRNAEEIIKNNSKEEIEIPVTEKKADSINMEKIYSEVYTEPKDAYYELEPFKIYPEQEGIDLAITLEEAQEQIEKENKDEYKFALKITPAQKTIKDLGTEAFPYLISSFSTKYDASNKNRSKNLEIAAGKINGTVLLPGEIFSFNKVVGKRTVEEGYRDAKIYADGGVVDGLAGGICQISSTLYNAVLLANLEIVERRNHSFTTSYVPAGRDATVVYGTTDFQFKNSRTYPIKIEAEVKNGIAFFKIHGIAEETEYEIKIIPKTTQSIPYTTEYIQDATLAPGQQVIVQAGHSGCKVTTYKETKKSGIVVSREVLSNDTYKSMKAIIRIGP